MKYSMSEKIRYCEEIEKKIIKMNDKEVRIFIRDELGFSENASNSTPKMSTMFRSEVSANLSYDWNEFQEGHNQDNIQSGIHYSIVFHFDGYRNPLSIRDMEHIIKISVIRSISDYDNKYFTRKAHKEIEIYNRES